MNRQLETLRELFLRDPETGRPLSLDGLPRDNGDGSYSFEVCDTETGARWRHTARTEEVVVQRGERGDA